MADPEGINFNEDWIKRAKAHPRAVGSPLPRGGARRASFTDTDTTQESFAPPPPGRSLTSGTPSPEGTEAGSGVQRAINVIRMAVPFVQRLLPLLDGNIATAVSNVFTQHTQRPAPAVNLAPLQGSVTELQNQHRELRDQVMEQNASLNKVETQLEMVREATDRNTLEQQELMEDLKAVGNKVNVVAGIALVLLAISVLLNVFLYLHIQRVLP